MTAEVQDETLIQKRLFISGIAPGLTEEDLVRRLRSYGQLTDGLHFNRKNVDTTGTFVHCGLQLTLSQWARLRKLSGTILKGFKLRVEEAKQHWVEKKMIDDQRPSPRVPNARKRAPPGTLPAVESKRVKRGDLVKDSDITPQSRRQGWIRGRYGRALAILRREDDAPLKRNPDAISRLWGSAHPKLEQLTFRYDDEEEAWYDRRGREIKEFEIIKKSITIEARENGRVEVWGSDIENNEISLRNNGLDHATDTMARQSELATQVADEEEIATQLAAERSLALDLIGDMFKNDNTSNLESKSKSSTRDSLNIVKRYDPNALDSAESPDIDEAESSTELVDTPDSQNGVPQSIDQVEMNTENDSKNCGNEDIRSAISKQRTDGFINSSELTAIFKPSEVSNDKPFSLFQAGNSDEEDVDDESKLLDDDYVNNMHPDRLNLKDISDLVEHEETNANYLALARDRGFQQSGYSTDLSVFPLLLSGGSTSIWHHESSFFVPNIDSQDVKERWEESRGDLTRDWKRKRREGTKIMRKALARQGR